jgi:hypothetical protein
VQVLRDHSSTFRRDERTTGRVEIDVVSNPTDSFHCGTTASVPEETGGEASAWFSADQPPEQIIAAEHDNRFQSAAGCPAPC